MTEASEVAQRVATKREDYERMVKNARENELLDLYERRMKVLVQHHRMLGSTAYAIIEDLFRSALVAGLNGEPFSLEGVTV